MGRSVTAELRVLGAAKFSREHLSAANRLEFRDGESAETPCLRQGLPRDDTAHCSLTLGTFHTLPQPKSRANRPPSLLRAANPAKSSRPSHKPARRCRHVGVGYRFLSPLAQLSAWGESVRGGPAASN